MTQRWVIYSLYADLEHGNVCSSSQTWEPAGRSGQQLPLLLPFLRPGSISELEVTQPTHPWLWTTEAVSFMSKCVSLCWVSCVWERQRRRRWYSSSENPARACFSERRNKMCYSSVISCSQFPKRKERTSCWGVVAILAVKITCLPPCASLRGFMELWAGRKREKGEGESHIFEELSNWDFS